MGLSLHHVVDTMLRIELTDPKELRGGGLEEERHHLDAPRRPRRAPPPQELGASGVREQASVDEGWACATLAEEAKAEGHHAPVEEGCASPVLRRQWRRRGARGHPS